MCYALGTQPDNPLPEVDMGSLGVNLNCCTGKGLRLLGYRFPAWGSL
jgi:hypothetical protein